MGASDGLPGSILVWLAVVMQGLLAAAMSVQAVVHLREEEAEGRSTLVTTTGVRRLGWVGAAMLVLLVRVSILTVFGAAALVAGLRLVGADRDLDSQVVESTAAHLPGVAAIAVLALLLYSLRPGLVGLAWVAVGWAAVVAILAESLSLTEGARNLSPFHLVGQVPVDSADVAAAVWLLAATAVGAGVSGVALRRRDLLA